MANRNSISDKDFAPGDRVRITWNHRISDYSEDPEDLIPDSYKQVEGWDYLYGKIVTVLGSNSRGEWRLEIEPGVEILFGDRWMESLSPLLALADSLEEE